MYFQDRRYAAGLLAAAIVLFQSASANAQISAMPPSVVGAPGSAGAGLLADPMRDPMMTPPRGGGPSAADEILYGPSTRVYGVEPRGVGLPSGGGTCWTWQLLPDSLLYKSYLAGQKESRLASVWTYQRDYGWFWDATLGGRAGILRYGSTDDVLPEGYQIDIEGAAFPRLDAEHARDLVSADFRAGVPLTARRGPWQFKFAYYHISAHLGDEYMISHPLQPRLNYVRDSLVLGIALQPHPDWRLYYEVGYAFYVDGGALPWEMQMGVEYSPIAPSTIFGAPFAAGNVHLRQDNDFSGNFTLQAGWQWRGESGHLFRIGAQYFNGMSTQYQFYRVAENQLGVGLWYDF